MKTKEIETVIAHPLEEEFEIPSETTVVTRVEAIPTDLVPMESYDEKDEEIEKQFQEVYDSAMTAFEATTNTIDTIEPKYRARNEEVAVQYLTTALGAAREKALIKQHKDKITIAQSKSKTPGTVNNNLIVADRNELLKHILSKEQPPKQ